MVCSIAPYSIKKLHDCDNLEHGSCYAGTAVLCSSQAEAPKRRGIK